MTLPQVMELPLKRVASACLKASSSQSTIERKLCSGQIATQQHSSNDLKIPPNMKEQDITQKIKFSPQRSRDTTASQISLKLGIAGSGAVFGKGILGATQTSTSFNDSSVPRDCHVPVYDQINSVSLSSVMQTNVPQPFKVNGNLDRSGYLGMPGGHWAQNDKYISSDLHENHKKVESSVKIVPYFQHINLLSPTYHHTGAFIIRRHYSTPSSNQNSSDNSGKLSTRQKLQRAVKEYGTTVIVFHVTISLASLGLCYLLVSSGIDMPGLLHSIGIDLSKLPGQESKLIIDPNIEERITEKQDSEEQTEASTAQNVAVGVSTFVVAYAVHKVFAPVRIATTLTATPFIVRALRAKGILKPPKTKQ